MHDLDNKGINTYQDLLIFISTTLFHRNLCAVINIITNPVYDPAEEEFRRRMQKKKKKRGPRL